MKTNIFLPVQVFFIIFIFLLPPWFRCFIDSKNHLGLARENFSMQDYEAAFNNYRLASTFDAPGILSSKIAAEEAFNLIPALPTEKQLPALWELKSGIAPVSSWYWNTLYHPYRTLLISINQKIDALANPEERALLEETYPPRKNLGFQILACLTFLFWTVGIFGWIWKKFDISASKIKGNNQYLTWSLVSYILWLICLYRA